MSNELLDPKLAFLAAADPIDSVALRAIATSSAVQDMGAAVVSNPQARAIRPRRGRHRATVLAVAAAVATAIPLTLTLIAPTSGRSSAYAAAAIRFAQQSPRLVVGASGWRVTDLNDEDFGAGNINFAGGNRKLTLNWATPATSFDPISSQIEHPSRVEIAGRRAVVGRVRGSGPSTYEVLWSAGNIGIAVEGAFPTKSAFLAVARTMRSVSVDQLLAALPRDEVTPAGRSAAVHAMLADIPQPPDFDPSRLYESTLLLDRYQLGADVALHVSCAWYHQWLHGSTTQKAQAAAAMSTSHHWQILLEMRKSGALPDSIWQGADWMNGAPLGAYTSPGETKASLIANRLCP